MACDLLVSHPSPYHSSSPRHHGRENIHTPAIEICYIRIKVQIRNAAIALMAVVFVAAYVQVELVSAQVPVLDQALRDGSQQATATSLTGRILDWARIAQSLFTVIAILAGGFLAWRNWQLFRSREPHVTISHQISHRHIGAKYVHIAVTATLHNSSRVNVDFRDGAFTLQQVAPVSDKDVENLYAQVFVDEEQTYLQWATLDDARRTWGEDEFVVEPGESETETYEFIVSKHVESVAVTTYFYNSRVLGKIPDDIDPQEAQRRRGRLRRWREVRGPPGWGRTTIYDMLPSSDRAATVDSAVDGRRASDAGQEENDHHS